MSTRRADNLSFEIFVIFSKILSKSKGLVSTMHVSKIHLTAIVFTVHLTWTSTIFAQQADFPNECDRGVKRHHPSQANVYQVFTRQDYRKQWLDYTCPEYMIFDPRLCQCAESPKPETLRQKQRPYSQKPRSRQRRPQVTKQTQTPIVEDVKDGYIADDDVEVDTPHASKAAWSQQEKSQDWEPQQQKQDKWAKQLQQFPKEQQVDPVYDSKQDSLPLREDKFESPSPKSSKPKNDGECNLHRPTGNPSMFERWSDGQWVEEDCNWPFYTGLVWNQASCRCVWGPNRTVAVPNVQDSITAACLMMLKLTFDGGHIKDEGRHIWLNIRNKEAARVESDPSAVGGKCGSFRGSSIAIPYFKSNVLGDIFHIGFMFKLCPGEPDTDIPLIHNDCIESGEDGPGIMVIYQAWRKQVIVSIRTVNSPVLVSEYCAVGKPQNDWIKIDIRYSNSFLEVRTNNEICAQSAKFYGVVATNNCPLTLLGESFCGSLDEVVITRGCTNAHAVS